jgi:hypothetical protein
MKKFLFLIIILFPSISFAGGDYGFSHLDEKCLAANYATHNEGLILKHINGRITKTENFVRYDRYIYMVANTFTDDYKFLGSYLMQYDCGTMSKKILSPLLKKGLKGELGKIEYF